MSTRATRLKPIHLTFSLIEENKQNLIDAQKKRAKRIRFAREFNQYERKEVMYASIKTRT